MIENAKSFGGNETANDGAKRRCSVRDGQDKDKT